MVDLMRQVHGHLDERCAALDLTRQQALLLAILDEPLPMGVIAERLGCDASNITGIADRLEARGLVERRGAASDRRVRLLARTGAGTSLERALREDIWSASPLIAGLTTGQQEQLRDLLRLALHNT